MSRRADDDCHGRCPLRRGFFLGDGTGAGKAPAVADPCSTIWAQGRPQGALDLGKKSDKLTLRMHSVTGRRFGQELPAV